MSLVIDQFDRLNRLIDLIPKGAQLIRALNVLTVKIVDRSDHTATTSAFLRLLREMTVKRS